MGRLQKGDYFDQLLEQETQKVQQSYQHNAKESWQAIEADHTPPILNPGLDLLSNATRSLTKINFFTTTGAQYNKVSDFIDR